MRFLILSLALSACSSVPYKQTKLVNVVTLTGEGSGTAFAVGEHLLLTAGHVCQPYSNIFIERRPVTVVKVDLQKDLCLLFTLQKQSHILRLSSFEPVQGQAVKMLGYPLGVGPILTEGSMAFYAQTSGKNRYALSLQANQGNSGSPIVNDQGRVVSVLVAGIESYKQISFGVTLEDLRDFLSDVQ